MLSNAVDLISKDVAFWVILPALIAVATILGEIWARRKGRCL